MTTVAGQSLMRHVQNGDEDAVKQHISNQSLIDQTVNIDERDAVSSYNLLACINFYKI